MPVYKLIVLSRPIEGMEAEYNDWYDNRHLSDVLAVPGFVSAERCGPAPVERFMDTTGSGQYLAIYTIESENVEQALADLKGRSNGPQMPLSPALDRGAFKTFIFETRS